jgi:SAM-dependent methyltransferase
VSQEPAGPYYRRALARVHDLGFGGYADACAPGVLELLRPVRDRGGLVLELGCGSGALTRHLVTAGHRVLATDASEAMLELARTQVGDGVDVRRLTLPDDPVPEADAIVSVGHALNYLPDAGAVERALAAVGAALRPGGVLVLDLCDRRYGEARRAQPPSVQVTDAWAILVRYEVPAPDRFVRDISVFVRGQDGRWERDDERHDNVLVDTSSVAALLGRAGVDARLEPAIGSHELPEGMVAVVGRT